MSQQLGEAGAAGGRLSGRRRLYGLAVAAIGAPLLTACLIGMRNDLRLDTVLLLFILVAVAASAVGGVIPAVAASLLSLGLANFFFTPPYGSLWVQNPSEIVDLAVFAAVAVGVGIGTEASARATGRAERGRIEAAWLTGLANRATRPDSVERALSEARSVYGANRAALLEDDRVLASSGEAGPDDQLLSVEAGGGRRLELSGPERLGQDRSLLDALAQTTGRLWQAQRLAEQARRAEELAKIDELRASLLAAVGHDLRNPLAAITAAASTLEQTDIELTEDDRAELLATISEHATRLNSIISNLLDASRLQAGALSVHPAPTDLLDVLAGVLVPGQGWISLELPDDLPLLRADAGLLERVLANLIDNAGRHGHEAGVEVSAAVENGRAVIRVVDHGPGVAPQRLAEIFAPFQHFGDRVTAGVGLGLAIAKGFTEAMGGTLVASPTRGGGLTMTVTLEVA